MSEQVEVRAELLRLGRLLGHEAEQLDYLAGVPAAELKALRNQITDVLFAENQLLNRIAAATKIVPAGLAASLSERVFGAVLSARLAGLVDTDKAVELAGRLPIPFLADIAVELDPRRAGPVLARIPAAQVAAVAKELLRRGEYVTMGTIVGHIPDESVAAALAFADALSLLQVALVLENKDDLSRLFALIGDERVTQTYAAAEQAGLIAEGLGLLPYLTEAQRTTVLQAVGDAAGARRAG
jgi:hypothetical protein